LERNDVVPRSTTAIEAVERIAVQGDRILRGLREASQLHSIAREAARFREWWSSENRRLLLCRALTEARKDFPKCVFEVPTDDIRQIPYYDYWQPTVDTNDFPRVYYAVKNEKGATRLYRVSGKDPLDSGATGANPLWTLSYDRGFRDLDYKRVDGISGGPPTTVTRPIPFDGSALLAPNNQYGRKASRNLTIKLGGNKVPLAALEEICLDCHGCGGGSTPTTVLRYSKASDKTALDILGEAYVHVERRTRALADRLRETLVSEIMQAGPPIIEDLTRRFGILCGSLTIAAWRSAEGLLDFSPPLVDGEHQVPATIHGIVDLLVSGEEYSHPCVTEEAVLMSFFKRLDGRINAALSNVERGDGSDLAMIARRVFDLRHALPRT
jgi:hypothetical protein